VPFSRGRVSWRRNSLGAISSCRHVGDAAVLRGVRYRVVGAAASLPPAPDRGAPAGNHPRAWAVPIGLLVLLYAVSFLSLPPVEAALHERLVGLGWIDR
jgi:hypothetical protein